MPMDLKTSINKLLNSEPLNALEKAELENFDFTRISCIKSFPYPIFKVMDFPLIIYLQTAELFWLTVFIVSDKWHM